MKNLVLIVFFMGVGLTAQLQAEIIVFNDDGAWNWLQDDRAIVASDHLIVGSVAAGSRDPRRKGQVEAVVYHLKTGTIHRTTLRAPITPAEQKQWHDDHISPAFQRLPDGRVLAVYAQHGRDGKIFSRVTSPRTGFRSWEDERVFAMPTPSRVTFFNLHYLPAENAGQGRLFNFFRGLESRSMPSWADSADAGLTWTAGNVFVQGSPKAIPYVKYANNGRDTLHFAFSEGHRVNFGNGIYHAYYRDGRLYRSDGKPIRGLQEGLSSVGEATRIFQADPHSIAMMSDLRLDAHGHPHLVYSVQIDTGRSRPRPIGADHRYRYARWTGSEWRDYEIAYAGGEVHAVADDDCTGLIALDPQSLNVVYISTNADPVTGEPLVSAADQKRHWEIYKGTTLDGGAKWTWAPLTRHSLHDNIRPIVPTGPRGKVVVLWLRGEMRMPNDYTLSVVGLISD